MELELIEAGEGFRLGAIGPVAVSVWESTPRVAHAEASVGLLQRLGRSHDQMALLAILADGCAIPDERVRGVLAAGIITVADRIVGVANVVEGQGFRAAALRGALTSLALVMSPRYPQKVFSEVATAAEFLQGHAPRVLRAREIVRGVAQLRVGETA